MRVITNRRLIEFAAAHPKAGEPLQNWRRIMESKLFCNFSELRQTFNNVDKVGDLYVFDIGGNKYRLVAYLHLERQIAYIKHILTHNEYDLGTWRKS
ncbi:MAG: type II toxin-antitoxin system HigB family toxin [Pigmentiphaga sp.]